METALAAAKAAVDAARENLAAAEANLRQARAHELLTEVSARTVDQTRADAANARALAEEAKVEEGYTHSRLAHQRQSGRVGGAAGRSGHGGRGHCHHHGPDADLGLRASAGDAGRRRATGRQFARGDAQRRHGLGQRDCEGGRGDFATQRDVNSMKRDIKTIQLKLLIPNPGEKFVPGMTAEVYIPKAKLVKK